MLRGRTNETSKRRTGDHGITLRRPHCAPFRSHASNPIKLKLVFYGSGCRFGHSNDTDEYGVGMWAIAMRVVHAAAAAAADIDTDTHADPSCRRYLIALSNSVRWYVIPLLVATQINTTKKKE